MVCATCKASDQPAHARGLVGAFAGRLGVSMVVGLLTGHHLEFLSLNGGYACSSGSARVKVPHCWKALALAHIILFPIRTFLLQAVECKRNPRLACQTIAYLLHIAG